MPPPPSETWLARARAQPLRWAALVFVATLLLALAAWPLLAGLFSALFRGLCSLVLSPLSFGHGGHVAFTQGAQATGLERAASWDTHMVLRIEGVAKAHSIALNPRRLLYLPLSTLLACVLAMPLPNAARRRASAVGALVLLVLALASVWLVAAFLFAQVPGLVYELSPLESSLLRVLYEGWVTPLSNKFMVPLLLGYALFAWQRAKLRVDTAAAAPPLGPEPGPRSELSPKAKRAGGRQRKRASGAR